MDPAPHPPPCVVVRLCPQQCLHVLSVIAGLDARGVPVWNDVSVLRPAQLRAVTVLQGRDLHLCARIFTRRPDGDEQPPPTE